MESKLFWVNCRHWTRLPAVTGREHVTFASL